MNKNKKVESVLNVGSYKYLPCLLSPGNVQRNIYFKQHRQEKDKPTLFVTNIPPFCPLVEILRVFSQFGSITSVLHGSLNDQGNKKVRSLKTTKQLTKIDLNQNINVGRTFTEDYDLQYKKLNDINALEAKRAEIRLALRQKKRGKSKDEEIIEKEDGDSDDSSSEDNEDFNELPEQPDFLGCEYLHISYSKGSDLSVLFSLSIEDLVKYDFTINMTENAELSEDEECNTSTSAVSRWINQYYDTIEDIDKLESESNEYMKNFDEQRRKEAEERKAKMNEDGWVTVTASKKRKSNDGSVQMLGVKAESVILRRSKKSKILDNFYKFQKHEQRKEKLNELRKQFEDDKNRIEQMKAAREFKPF